MALWLANFTRSSGSSLCNASQFHVVSSLLCSADDEAEVTLLAAAPVHGLLRQRIGGRVGLARHRVRRQRCR